MFAGEDCLLFPQLVLMLQVLAAEALARPSAVEVVAAWTDVRLLTGVGYSTDASEWGAAAAAACQRDDGVMVRTVARLSRGWEKGGSCGLAGEMMGRLIRQSADVEAEAGAHAPQAW